MSYREQVQSGQHSKGYRSLILDLDGTLIGRDEKIAPRVYGQVIEAKEIIEVSIASGREATDVVKFARCLGLTTLQIADNGALILDPRNGNKIWSAPLGNDRAQVIIDKLVTEDLVFIAQHATGSITNASMINDHIITCVSALDMNESDADQLVSHFRFDLSLNVVKVILPYNDKWAVDFTLNGIDKGTALLRLACLKRISPNQIITVGDSYNDLALLRSSGLGIAMGDAPKELKDLADFVAPTLDNDGLAVAIQEFILPMIRESHD